MVQFITLTKGGLNKRFLYVTERMETPSIIKMNRLHSISQGPYDGLKRGSSKLPSSKRF